ncbi:hypothetical protein PT974_00125 [Cladobotryum mycophilum]|uniref:Uncharacterized protein n=1 Tax=Cladobotryum mycophilum TaxID=491253 RepID=A0ABR0SZX8_9HYPO
MASTSVAAASNPNNEAISDGNSDIARMISLERMKTEATGRRPFQKVYLWTTTNDESSAGSSKRKRATTLKYNPATDGPARRGPCPILPLGQELLPHIKAKAYLEVGIVIGDEPEKYKPSGISRDKTRDAARKMRGTLPRHANAMRAFIPISEYIQSQSKFYENVDSKKPAKERLREVSAACKTHAAVKKMTKEAAERAGVSPFLSFNHPLTERMSQKVLEDLQRATPAMERLDPRVVQVIHQVVCSLSDDKPLVEQLQQNNLAFFLELCQVTVRSTEIPRPVIVREVKSALAAARIHSRHLPSSSASNSTATARVVVGGGDGDGNDNNEEEDEDGQDEEEEPDA